MRVAAVQLTSTADRERNLATADRLTRAAAAAGAELVVLPEKWPVLGTPEETDAGAEPFDGPALPWARARRASSASTLSPARSPSACPPREGPNTSVHFGPDGEVRAVYRKIHMFDVEVAGRMYRESEHEAPRRRDRALGDRRRRRARADHLLRPALPRAVPDPRGPRRAR